MLSAARGASDIFLQKPRNSRPWHVGVDVRRPARFTCRTTRPCGRPTSIPAPARVAVGSHRSCTRLVRAESADKNALEQFRGGPGPAAAEIARPRLAPSGGGAPRRPVFGLVVDVDARDVVGAHVLQDRFARRMRPFAVLGDASISAAARRRRAPPQRAAGRRDHVCGSRSIETRRVGERATPLIRQLHLRRSGSSVTNNASEGLGALLRQQI